MKYVCSLVLSMFLSIFSMMSFATGSTVTYQVNGQDYEGYFVNAGKEAPLVLLIHDWDGVTEYEIKRAQMLAALGYSVFAADLFGKGVRPTVDDDKKRHIGALYEDRQKMRDLMNGALAEAAKLGASNKSTVAMGYCFGGAAVLELARSGTDLKGYVSFHGGLTTPKGQSYAQTKGRILVLHGGADSMISMNDFATLANELEAANIANEMISYGGAPHAFTVFGSERYREEADRLSWARFTAFLRDVTQ